MDSEKDDQDWSERQEEQEWRSSQSQRPKIGALEGMKRVFWLRIKNVYFMDFLIQRQGEGKVGKGGRSFLKEKKEW